MAVNKGLKSLIESTPNFSNQALENSIDAFKIGWAAKSIELDTAINDNTVLTTSQKNDLKDEINNVAHLNVGRYIGDLLRHTNTLLDGSILPVDDTVANPSQGTFLELLQLVQTLQDLIPETMGVTAAEKNRSVNDHFGTINNKFLNTEDSSQPVFTALEEAITFINAAALATDTTYKNAIDDLKNFVNGLTGDSTDFQTSLDNRSSTLQTAANNFDTALQAHPYSTKRTQIISAREAINTQVNLENSNAQTIRSFTETLTDNLAFTTLAEDDDLRKLMANVAQNENWQTYFNNYDVNSSNENPIYNTDNDSDKSATIDAVLASQGLPDVLDSNDFEAVVNKAKLDPRIDTKGFEFLYTEQIITQSCKQLGISTRGSIENQSELLLNNLNKRDRDRVASELDLSQDSNTLS
tara:strand:- start:377 stop:1609 length:1233 start_codon:yes stop_codon:yes gene_type:complete